MTDPISLAPILAPEDRPTPLFADDSLTHEQRYNAFVVAGWLFGIVINLLTKNAPQYYDIALRDFGLMLAALTFARLALAVVPARKSGALPRQPW